LAKNPNIMEQIRKMTNIFHYSDTCFKLEPGESERYRKLLAKEFNETYIERIMQLLDVGDPFVIRELETDSLTKEASDRLRYDVF
jgi:hypothetical protein